MCPDDATDRGASAGLDRRAVLGGAAGVAATAWVAPAVLSIDAAGAQSPPGCAPTGTVDFSDQVTFPAGTPGNGLGNYPWVLGSFAGTTVTLSLSGTTTWVQFGNAGVTRTCVQAGQTGGITGYYRIDRDQAANGGTPIPSGAGAETIIEVAFSQVVCNLALTILDADQNLSGGSVWTDQVVIEPLLGATPVSGTFTPGSTMNPNTPQVGTSVTFTGNSTNNVGDASATANVGIAVAAPADRIRIRYRMAMPGGVVGNRQHIGLSSISWTP